MLVSSVKGPYFFVLHTIKNAQRWTTWKCLILQLFPGPPNLLLHRWGLGLTRTWLPFWLKKNKMLDPIYCSFGGQGVQELQVYRLTTQTLRKRNSHEEGDSGSTQDLFDSDEQGTAPCTACTWFLTIGLLQPRDGPGELPVHQDFAMHFEIIHTGGPRSPWHDKDGGWGGGICGSSVVFPTRKLCWLREEKISSYNSDVTALQEKVLLTDEGFHRRCSPFRGTGVLGT